MKRNINTRVLDGFIKQAVSHNKYLEESEMWKKRRELEENADKKPSSSKRHRRASSASDEEPNLSGDQKKAKDPAEIDDLQVLLELYRESKNPSNEKWGHSGFTELYPDHGTRRPESSDRSQRNRSLRSFSSSSSRESRASAERSERKKSKHKSSKRKKSHSRPKKKKKKKKEKGLK